MTATATCQEVAAMLRVTPETVRNLANQNRIPAFKVGRLWRFDPDEVRKSLEPSTDPWAQSPASLNARRKR